MRASLPQLLLLGSLALCASACSWSRFEDVTKDSPVVLLEKPDSMNSGFGVSLSTATNAGQTRVLVGGTATASNAALFELGQGDAPQTATIDTNYCTGKSGPCSLSSLTAGFANATGPDAEHRLCFAVGSGALQQQGLVMRCDDHTEYALAMPQAAQDRLAATIAANKPEDYPMATDRKDDPLLLASLPELRLAWFYPPKSTVFSELVPPSGLAVDDPSFGRALAVLAVDGGHVLALGVSGKSQVLLWKTDDRANVSYIGCLGEGPGTGRALASGNVNNDGSDDLVIADDSSVQVLSGATLFALPETDSSECVAPGTISGALLGWFGCVATSTATDCDKSEFGAALAVGDLDGDGRGEVIVGAPKMTVRGEKNAGALLVYTMKSTMAGSLVDTKFISSAESGDELGRSIVTPRLANRDIIAAGAPGHGKAALFYCSSLLGHSAASARCH